MRQYAIRRPVENTYLVRQRDRRRVRDLVGVLVVVCLAGCGLLAYTWMHVEILQSGYAATKLELRRDAIARMTAELGVGGTA